MKKINAILNSIEQFYREIKNAWHIKHQLKTQGIEKYEIKKNSGFIYILEDVDLSNQNLGEIPLIFKGTIVKGNFDVSNNQLTSLLNSPVTVQGDFDCHHNKLVNLQHCPDVISGTFKCSHNALNSMEFLPTAATLFMCDGNSQLGELQDKFYLESYQKIQAQERAVMDEKKLLENSVIPAIIRPVSKNKMKI